jgi:GNAT superfamily N-acetyltransferase
MRTAAGSGADDAAGMMARMSDTIAIRTVDRFDEPAFTELVQALLWEPDRREVGERLFGAGNTTPPPSGARQVRIGAFAGEDLVGWSHAWLAPGGHLYVGNSAVVPRYRRQGVYTRLVSAIEDEARSLHCVRIESHHRAGNNAVLIAKLKAGYTIVGTEFTTEMGLLVKMARQLDERRHAVFHARAGVLEGSARFFGSEPGVRT